MHKFVPELTYLFICTFFRFKFSRKKETPTKFKHYYTEWYHAWFFLSYMALAKLGLFNFIREVAWRV